MMQEMQREFKKLKQKGYTLQEIGTQYGISRQRVFQVLNYDYQRSSAPQPTIEQIVYPNIRGWLIKNNKTPKQLAKMADIPYYTLLYPIIPYIAILQDVLNYHS